MRDNFSFTRTLTAAQFAFVAAFALKVGVKITAPGSGTLPKHEGTTLAYNLAAPDAGGNVLATITIIERPALASDNEVEKIVCEKLQLPTS